MKPPAKRYLVLHCKDCDQDIFLDQTSMDHVTCGCPATEWYLEPMKVVRLADTQSINPVEVLGERNGA